MRLLVVGGGAREHAIIWKLNEASKEHEIYCAPGNAGIGSEAHCIDISASDIEGLIDFVEKNHIEFTIVGNEEPLSMGIVDRFNERGLKILGPTKSAALIEASKAFSKDFMERNHIPTAKYRTFSNREEALQYAEDSDYPLVIKADGLALGKGVIICQTFDEAATAIDEMMVMEKFGGSGRKIVIEEFLEGEEVSVLAFCDGRTAIPMVPAQDYKKAMDYDKGLNTGGMGSFSPCKVYTKEIEEFCFERILKPTINAMRTEGRPFQGILFLGLILTQKGPKVIEYNARFGDPETQSVMLRLKTDLLEILLACQEGTLDKIKIQWEDNAAVCVVMASGCYPENYEKGFEIKGLNFYKSSQDIIIFHAGTKEKGTNILTNGGRVLSVCARGKTIEEARNKAYEAAETISFDGAFYRKDIALKGI